MHAATTDSEIFGTNNKHNTHTKRCHSQWQCSSPSIDIQQSSGSGPLQNRSNRQVRWGQHTHTDTFTVLPLSFSRIGGGSAGTRSCRHDQTDHDDQLCQPVLTIVGTDQSRNGLMLERTRFCNLRTNRCRYLSVQPTAWGNKAMSSARTDHDD